MGILKIDYIPPGIGTPPPNQHTLFGRMVYEVPPFGGDVGWSTPPVGVFKVLPA